MASLFSEETKRRLELNLVNQIAVPTNLDTESSRHNCTRLFSPSELFSVLYGKTRLQPANEQVLSDQGTTQLVAVESISTACEFCQKMPQGRCPMHKTSSQTQTSGAVPYAIKSLPPECRLCPSSAAGEGYGVYTNQNIPLGTWIGPYEGRRVRPCDVTPNMDTSHMWEIYEGRTLSHYIDGSDQNTASWMRFIRCARHKDEQNLFAFQYNENIYYRAFKDIPYGTELLVWYDENYPMYMGIPLAVQTDTVFTPSVNTTAQFNSFVVQERKQSKGPQTQQPGRSISETHDTTQLTNTNGSAQFSHTRSSVRSFQDPRNIPSSSKNLPPLIPNHSARKRRASVDGVLSEQRLSTVGDLESGTTGNLGNGKVPSPKSPVSELTSWQCQQCHKTFTQRVALQIHVCPSQPTNPFQCGQCSSTFNNSSELRAHVVSHTTERPFKCGFCSRTFVGATTLNNHVRTHMGQKPFGCEK